MPYKTGDGLYIIDVIIVNYNSTDHLLRCLKSLFDASLGLAVQVLVHDNASKDNIDRVSSLFPLSVLPYSL